MALQCEPLALSRRIFWTTQPDACGMQEPCDNSRFECGRPGLSLLSSEQGATFATNDWVRSLAINMLMTDARRLDTRCGHRPGTMNGHWSESYNPGGEYIGSRLRYIPATTSIREATQLIKAEVISTMQKLVNYGVAVAVEVVAEYQGNGLIFIEVDILGVGDDRTKVGMSAQRGTTSWAWVS